MSVCLLHLLTSTSLTLGMLLFRSSSFRTSTGNDIWHYRVKIKADWPGKERKRLRGTGISVGYSMIAILGG
jgi:hypothetical protein